MARSTGGMTDVGGPPTPSRKDGKYSSRPTACAARAVGNNPPSSTPTATNAIELTAIPADARSGSCTAGTP